MTEWLETIIRSGFVFGGVGFAIATLLVLASAVLLQGERRRRVRVPAFLLGLALIAGLVRIWLPNDLRAERPVEVVAVFLLLTCIGRAGFILVADGFLEQRLRRPMPQIFREVVQALIYFVVLLATLRAMGAEFGSLLTTSALLTAVIGLSLQETLGSLVAGLAIQAQRPFQVGDWIQLQGTERATIGKVTEINWRATHLLTTDSVEIIIPNGVLAKSPILNFTKPTPVSRRVIKLQGPYDVPPHIVERVLIEAARGCPGVTEDPPPSTGVTQYADSGIEYALSYGIDDFSRQAAIDSDVRRRCWYGLQRAGVSMPFPVRELRLSEAMRPAGLFDGSFGALANAGGAVGAAGAVGPTAVGSVAPGGASTAVGSVATGGATTAVGGAATGGATTAVGGAATGGATTATGAAVAATGGPRLAGADSRVGPAIPANEGSARTLITPGPMTIRTPFGMSPVGGAPRGGQERLTAQQRASERLLRKVDFLSVLPAEVTRQLAREGRICLFASGEDIIRQGEPGNELFILQHGEASVLVMAQSGIGPPIELARLTDGSVFGEMALVTGEPRTATVRAIAVCELLVIHHESLRGVLETNLEFVARISEVLASRQAQLQQAHAAVKTEEHTRHSGFWMNKILDFFSLGPPKQ